MDEKIRIAILGLGGVGGYYGGKLAAYYTGSSGTEIIFIARGENEKVIRGKGLQLITPSGEQFIHPKIISHDPAEIGEVDFLICCVKAYDLEESLGVIAACISPHTIIIPLLNGVNNTERIQAVFPLSKIWKGCAYIVSRLIAPGVVKEGGPRNELLFGSETETEETIKAVENIFTQAGINAKGIQAITPVLWTKFIFLSPIATMTTARNLPIGAVLADENHKATLQQLIIEIAAIAITKGIGLPDDIVNNTMQRIQKLPFETSSSMQYDFVRGKKTEVDSLTGYVVKLGQELNIPTPVHEQLLSRLKIM